MEKTFANTLAESHDYAAATRTIARSLTSACQVGTLESLEGIDLKIALLTAGLDPNKTTPSSLDYRFGAAEALATIHNAVTETAISTSTTQMLLRKQRGRVLAAIAAQPGLTQKSLAERINVRESNLSTYLREIAGAGLIEPALPLDGRGKAWGLSPWGAKTFLLLIEGPIRRELELNDDEIAAAVRGASELHGRLSAEPAAESLLSREELYTNIEQALERRSETPVLLSTLYAGDLRQHERPWLLHKRVFGAIDVNRPVNWVLVDDDRTQPWLNELLDQAEGNDKLSVWTCPRSTEPRIPVQVLDGTGLLYPLPPHDSALKQTPAAARESWELLRDESELRIDRGVLAPA